jgi:metal-sulfur cluster biosynthetic enzyme
MLMTEETVMEALKEVQDPELRLGIVDLGLIYGADVKNEGRVVEVRMTLTSPGCPYGPTLLSDVKRVVGNLPGVESSEVKIIWDPPWDPRTMASDEIKDKLGIW